MPHCLIEYASELEETLDVQALVHAVYRCAKDSQLFAEGTVKVRASSFAYYQTDFADPSFVHLRIHLFPGRSAEQKQRLSGAMLTALEAQAPKIQQLSVELLDIDTSCYSKRILD
ncbi:5-carboxymethyl-2-hydroxymuconate Delta-isomerase [Aliagarivorans marinus]|uniref:5-carboxymethyl-2-hydroxymuconate Delta-isomerase n=1 Tax=Aliagarivorans marinus TaxID=561965 RepID=UPI0003F917D2|nr:5-carboxymethyl-2-hydroxymuconate Delta-isomerase [Aliagarivorans marinus]